MDKNDNRKHEHYELLNLLGYGLAKFDKDFFIQFGFTSKSSFYQYLIDIGVSETVGTIKNRQDMMDPFFDNKRSGWWQKSDQYIGRKLFIDSLFGNEDVVEFSKIVKLYLQKDFKLNLIAPSESSPILKSRFKQLQETGQEAELYFLHNYNQINNFTGGDIKDARTFGDGYDFQIEINSNFFLAEVKGVRNNVGGIRMTENEYKKAIEYEKDYFLIIISNLSEMPKITSIENPIKNLSLKKNQSVSTQINYHTENLRW